MGLFSNMLLATDFDGTLANDSGVIPQSVRDAIRFFINEGGYFTVCTGRTKQGFHKYDKSIINAPVLLANGAMAFDYESEQIVFCDGIGKEGILPVMEIHAAFPKVAIEMYPLQRAFSIGLTPDSERHFTDQNIQFEVINDAAQALFPWSKAMLGAGSDSPAVQEFLRQHQFSDIDYLPTTGSFVEILKKGVDKGTGLMKLAAILGVLPQNTFAVGDGYNDVAMLRAASAGFVPANGDCEAKSAATYIVRSNNEGAVAHVIELLLKQARP